MNKVLRKLLTGLSVPQEYVCVGPGEFKNPLRVFLSSSLQPAPLEVTGTHLFLGYKPLVIEIISPSTESPGADEICLSFNSNEFTTTSSWLSFPADRIARLKLHKIRIKQLGSRCVTFYEGDFGEHRFISKVHQKFNSLLLRLTDKSVNNVYLNGNLYDQVRIAYALARTISLITVSDGALINIFPTDLHGPVGNDFYIGSLRFGGDACRQVELYRKIVISEMDALQFRKVYEYGKNHMKKLNTADEFDVESRRSAFFDFPLPSGVGFYREMELLDSFDAGIHRILIYKVVSAAKVREVSALTHVHQYYAQWRNDRGLDTNWLI